MDLERGIEEGGEIGEEQLDRGQSDQHREAGDQHGFAEELGDQLAALGAEHLAQRDLAGPLAGAGGGEVDEVDRRHGEDQQRDHRESDDRPPVVARPHERPVGAGQMDVADVDQPPVEIVALADLLVADGDRRDVAPLPGREAAMDVLRVRAGPELQIDVAVDAAPAAFLALAVADPAEHGEFHVAVARDVLDDAADPERILLAAADRGDGAAQDVDAAEAVDRLGAGEDEAVGPCERGARIAAKEGQLHDPEEIVVGQEHRREARLAVAKEDGLDPFEAGDRLDLREIAGERFGDDAVRALLRRRPAALLVHRDRLHLVDPLGLGQPGDRSWSRSGRRAAASGRRRGRRRGRRC